MALEIPSGSALTVALDSRRAVSRLAQTSTTSFNAANGSSLSQGLIAGRFVERSVTINPQGLDPFSLGISRLDVSTSETARLSEARLRGAAQTVGSRLERLSQLQAALGQTNGFDQSLISASANISGAVPIGALVNLPG